MKNTWFKFVFVLLFLSACGSEKQENTTAQNEVTEVATQSQSASKYFYINTPNNEQLANITIDGEKIQLSLKDGELFGDFKGEKRKYYTSNNQMQYAVKFSDDGFKLRDENEELLWKVKFYKDKIKLANNEEMANAYEVKQREGKLKIEQDGSEIETFRFNADAQSITVKDTYMLRGFGNSVATGILLLEEVPEKAKFILCAEVLKRGK